MTLRHSRRGRRGAYTLMELLIVIIIMITLVAITLPIAKKTMEDSGPREATRQLSTFFELAKTKAVQTGRPWGIWIECERPLAVLDYAPGAPPPIPTSVRQATKFYLAESPELYAGDVLDARVGVKMTLADNVTPNPQGPWPLLWGPAGGALNITPNQPFIVGNLYSLITGLNGSTAPAQKYEFFIRLNYAGPWFRGYVGPNVQAITGDNTQSYAFYIYGQAGADRVPQSGFITGSTPLGWGNANYDDDGSGTPDDVTEYLAAGSDDLRPPFPVTGANGATFQIVRPPQRVNNSLELGSGACVDLVYSGMGRSGCEFSGFQPGHYSNPGSGQNLSYYKAVVVMFLPGGGIDSIFYIKSKNFTPDTEAPGPGSVYGQVNATGNIHLLVGKVQKVANPAPYVGNPTGPGNSPQYGADMFDPDQSNLMDSTSFWVSIGRFNGAITTSENSPPARVSPPLPSTTHLYQYIDPSGNTAAATINTLDYRYISNPGTPPTYGRPALLEICRTIATGQQQMGGR